MRTRRTLTVAAVLALLLGVAVPAAFAHARLQSASPTSGETLDTMPAEVRLVFDEDVNRPSSIAVQAPDGTLLAEGEAELDGAEAFATLEDPNLAGTYCVNYRIISADAHPVTGEYTFEVTAGDEPDEPVDCAGEQSSRDRYLLWAIGGFLVIIVGLLAWNLLRNRDAD